MMSGVILHLPAALPLNNIRTGPGSGNGDDDGIYA